MRSRALANLVFGLHLAFGLFCGCGAVLARDFSWMPLLHVPAVAWNSAVLVAGWACPLTALENSLRGRTAESGPGFAERTLLAPLAIDRITPRGDVLLGLSAAALNVALYADLIRRGHLALPT